MDISCAMSATEGRGPGGDRGVVRPVAGGAAANTKAQNMLVSTMSCSKTLVGRSMLQVWENLKIASRFLFFSIACRKYHRIRCP